MVVALQPFLIQFTQFLLKNHTKYKKPTLYLNITETITLLEDAKIELPSKRKENQLTRLDSTRLGLVYPHIKYL